MEGHMTLDLRPETADALAALAQTRGMSVEEYLDALVSRERYFQLPASAPPMRPERLSPETWAGQFEQWADSFPAAPPIPDEALSREGLYPEQGDSLHG